ncbi:SCO family protein [Halocynthiibacter sp. C4]|uniref:SCO family protein n=1 Tax=Halocynthiibacter sp. C4 TaxID=2992758 RepID=UPI00237BD278|nr:SCO family protein [Halocynthiibacter sp. C4]MDE0591027.1 SCO family protein [Halocynthiibacter sp. C4]
MKYYAFAAVGAAAILLGTTAYLTFGEPEDKFAQCTANRIAGGASTIGGPFSLIDKNGERVTDKEVITKPSLVYFGYTFCPDVCPLDSARNADAVDILDEMGIETTPVFITIDPERDTPEVVGEFADVFHERMIGLTGTAEDVKAASRAYKTYYKKNESDDEYYLVDHSTSTYLTLPEYGTVTYFKRDDSPEVIAETIACFVENS